MFIESRGRALNLLCCIRCIYNYLFSCFLQPFFVVLFAASLRTVLIQMPGPSLCSLLTPFVCMYGNQRGVEEGDLTSSSFGYKQRLAMPSRQTKCSTCLPRRRGSRKWVYFSGFVCWLQSLVNWAVDCQPSCHIKSRVIAKVGRSK